MTARRSGRSRFPWPLPAYLLRYGLALLSVGVALLLMLGLRQVGAEDTRPAFLVAVALSALYGGLGPGLLALALAAPVAHDLGILAAGAMLVALCVAFRRPRSRRPLTPKSDQFGRFDIPPARFSDQIVQPTSPPFLELTTEATWRFHHEQPLDITLPEEEQVEHLYLYSVLAECNDAFARMYGFRTAVDVVGTRLVVFLPPTDPENVAYLRRFIRSGYRLEDAESHEIDRYGNAKYFVNNLVGIFERGQLIGAWGTQRDVSAGKPAEESQEYRSRAHSSKSSSQ